MRLRERTNAVFVKGLGSTCQTFSVISAREQSLNIQKSCMIKTLGKSTSMIPFALSVKEQGSSYRYALNVKARKLNM